MRCRAFTIISLTVCSTEEVKQNVEKAMKDVVDPIRTKVGPSLSLPPPLSLPLSFKLSRINVTIGCQPSLCSLHVNYILCVKEIILCDDKCT